MYAILQIVRAFLRRAAVVIAVGALFAGCAPSAEQLAAQKAAAEEARKAEEAWAAKRAAEEASAAAYFAAAKAKIAQKAARIQQICGSEEADDCAKAGYKFLEQKDFETAAEALEFACDKQHAEACANLGAVYWAEKFSGHDMRKAVQISQKACELGSAFGCISAGVAYTLGNGVEKSARDAAELFERGCDLGAIKGCSFAASLLGVQHPRYFALAKRASDAGDDMGHEQLARAYEIGAGCEKNEALALELFKKACRADNYAGCSAVTSYYLHGLGGVKKGLAPAIKLQDAACKAGAQDACYAAAVGKILEAVLAADAAPKQQKSAAWQKREAVIAAQTPTLKRGCEAGKSDICHMLGIAYAEAKNPAEAQKYYKRGCELGNAQSCAEMAEMLVE